MLIVLSGFSALGKSIALFLNCFELGTHSGQTVYPCLAPLKHKASSMTFFAQYRKAIVTRLVGVMLVTVCVLFSSVPFAQLPEGESAKLVVGALELPPFSMKTMEGTWEGLSFDLLDLIAAELDIEYEVREFTDVKVHRRALSEGTIDLISVLAATEEAETILDLTLPYYRSGFAIAVSGSDRSKGWTRFFRGQRLEDILSVVGALVLLWLLAGVAIWRLERNHNKAMFGGSAIDGLGHGFWWAAVTMSTVGYGDKAPVTLGGRAIAIIWMFVSIVVVSSFTASISASLTAEKLVGKVRGIQDLPHVRVGTMVDTSVVEWLQLRGVSAAVFPSARVGLQAIADGSIDAFVFDEAVLKSITATEFPGLVYLLPQSFEHYYISMGVRNESPMRESINRATLKIMVTDEWNRLLVRHVAAEP